jgi:N-acetylglucosamine-6-phosphate deacetylase
MTTIDIHTHGIGGFDTRTTKADDILAIAGGHGSRGVTAIIPTLYSSPIPIMRSQMEAVREAMDRQKNASTDSWPAINSSIPPLEKGGKGGFELGRDGRNTTPARIIGVHLEGPFLNPVQGGALDAPSFAEADEYVLMELLEGFEDIVRIITIAPEIRGAIRLIKQISGMGITVSMGHSDATYAEAEEGFHAGARGITHLFNAMRGIHHREPGIAGFGLLNRDIYIEVIADPYHLHQKMLDLVFTVKNRDRILLVSDSVKQTEEGGCGKKGVKDSAGKLLGGCMTIAESSHRLVQLGYDEGTVMNCITKNPAEYLQIDKR